MLSYLDHNASSPLDPRVLDVMLPYLRACGNASSVHTAGRAARAAIDRAREQVAALVNASPGQVIFTSGGTEANNLALKGSVPTPSFGEYAGGSIAIGATEHASLRGPALALRRLGYRVNDILVDGAGRVSLDALRSVLNPRTRLVSIMLANNETGVLQNIAALSGEVRAHGAIMHTDAVQATGKIAVDFSATGAQLMSLSAHKLNGPQGVGALIVDRSLELNPLLDGGGQEQGLRGGTENVAAIVGFGAAAELALSEMEQRRSAMLALRGRVERMLDGIPGVVIFAREADRLPNTVMFSVPGIDGEALVLSLDRAGFAVSSGSACASHRKGPSHVLLAMGIAPEVAQGSVRVSVGMGTTAADIDAFGAALEAHVEQFQSIAVRAWA
jgi:cysteine desulfurase